MLVEEKLRKLGIELPPVPEPVAEYLPYRKTGNLIYISGQDCRINGELKYEGKVGAEVTEEQGYQAAKIAVIRCLAVLKSAIADLDDLVQVVNLRGFVNSAPGFVRQPMVINGASEFLVQLFGEKGKHSRCALSANELPFNTPVEIEMVVEVKT
ncbi:MAG: RidA family protein [Halanaerobiales bacterium]|nr:RidA family protein [Halanaerobiales bacterium]